MASDEGGGGGGLIETIFTTLFDLVKEMLGAFFAVFPKILKFVIWVIGAIFILPCVFVAGNIYPKWVEWGEEF
jgi:hypothetical protein